MIQVELDDMLDFHRHWLRDKRFGTRADFTDKTLENLTFSYRNLTGAIFNEENIFSCKFINSNMSEITAVKTHFKNCDFTNAIFKNAYLQQVRYTLSIFSNTDLWNVSGDGIYIISLQLGGVNVCYTSEILQINCLQFDIEEIWWMSTDDVILKTGRDRNEIQLDKMEVWWDKWKYQIYQIVKNSPARPINSPE